MARQVIWTYEADTDLESIATYIAKDSTFYAATFVQRIRETSQTLKTLSERGRIVPEINESNIRELLVGNYRLIYKADSDRVTILALIHGAMDFKKLL
ncbi:MAG: type II toxin-antitoxin system RelE/ParE family toxin [Deltaproteobacteria bacterium]|nr:type II toxin-antitoxin system RelE/ParE family toxin [Deltaproteobacteria bacterium]